MFWGFSTLDIGQPLDSPNEDIRCDNWQFEFVKVIEDNANCIKTDFLTLKTGVWVLLYQYTHTFCIPYLSAMGCQATFKKLIRV